MDCLSRRRADVYGDWIEIGMCLHSTTIEGEVGDLFDLWVAFSKQSSKYPGHEAECLAKWATFGKDGGKHGLVTERTLNKAPGDASRYSSRHEQHQMSQNTPVMPMIFNLLPSSRRKWILIFLSHWSSPRVLKVFNDTMRCGGLPMGTAAGNLS